MSTKAEKKQIKEAKKVAAKRKEKLKTLLIRLGTVIIAPIVLFVFWQGLFSGPPTLPPDVISDADHVFGSDDAKVTITVYADFQCPACLTESDVIRRAWSRISEDARLIYRHFPLDTHRFSFKAARYAEAAGKQGRFWEMHDLLFGNQVLWSTIDDASQFFDEYAQQIGLNMEQLQSDLDSAEIRGKINADQQSGIRAGVRSTPAMFINGRLAPNPQSPARLVEMVREALDKQAGAA